jgi:site-specific recombinase XerD
VLRATEPLRAALLRGRGAAVRGEERRVADDRLPARISEVDPDRLDPSALPAALSPELLADLADGADLVRKRRAANTVRAYESDLRVLRAYLRSRGAPDGLPVDPLLLVGFISAESRPDDTPGAQRPARAASTIDRRIAAIGKAHQLAGLPDPTKDQRVRDALTGARRRLGRAGKEKDALALEDLEQMLRGIDRTTHAGRRDAALLLVGIAGALRRAELVALDAEDVRFVPEGMLVSIRRAKTDQEGRGETLAIAHGDRPDLCAVRALRAWLDATGIREGAIFRRVRAGDRPTEDRLTDQSVALVVKKHAARVGLDPRALAGHSLRSGGITAAVREGHDERELARLSRHKDMSVLRGYIRREDAFEDAAQVLTSRKRG